jgi:hypothetical protein
MTYTVHKNDLLIRRHVFSLWSAVSKIFKNQPRPLVRPSSVNYCQIFWNLSHETVPVAQEGGMLGVEDGFSPLQSLVWKWALSNVLILGILCTNGLIPPTYLIVQAKMSSWDQKKPCIQRLSYLLPPHPRGCEVKCQEASLACVVLVSVQRGRNSV